MLPLKIESTEFYDEATGEFHYVKPCTLQLEHSLISISKWEAKWHKPFIPNGNHDTRTTEEIFDYIKCMTLNSNVPDEVYKALKANDIKKIKEYINDPMTASTVSKRGGSRGVIGRKYVTSELIYYWMVQFNIPFECEKWHLNRLMMLIKICDAENSDKKKMNPKEIARSNAALNAARRAKMHSKG